MKQNVKKYIAEFIGTLILVLFGCGTCIVTDGNLIATALAFGLAIVAAAYAIGDISGCHVNPAVSLAMLINKKLSGKDFVGYVISQILGGLAGSGLLFTILKSAKLATGNLGANGFSASGLDGISAAGAFLVEIILTFVFVYAVLGAASKKENGHATGIIIGLTLCFVHLFGINLTGTSVNPARSLAPALLQGGEALSQVWVFILAPLVGAILSALVFKYLNTAKEESKTKVTRISKK